LILRRGGENAAHVVHVPGQSIGAWLIGISGVAVTLFAMIIATIPPPDVENGLVFRVKVIGGALAFVIIGGLIYCRARLKENMAKVNQSLL
jgi:hypothetical protein